MIEAIELTSTRRSRGARGAPVEKVSFDVYPGQVTALLGAPGTGKSTVLRLMVELEPGGGRTLFGGRPFRALHPAIREVGLALNPDAVHPGRTVQAHLQLYSAAGGVPKGRVAEVLEVAGLSTQATVRCGRLDPGQRQRLSIAAALLGDPAALILDEPHALDSHGMSWFHSLIRAYATQGRTVLVAATDPDSLSGTADHVVILRRDEHDGVSRVIASRSAAEVFDERRATVVQVRSPQAARLAAALESEGARLSPAGPGALQVRGLDRARIGEVAHIAGICLHELSEIDHDEDVFGLRPVPRQKELLPGLNRADRVWRTGVRLVAEEIEEAEVVEAAEPIAQPVTVNIGAQAEAAGATVVSGGAMSAKVDNQTAETSDSMAETPRLQGTIASPRESTTTVSAPAQPDARARWRSQGSQWWAVKSVAERAAPDSSAEAQESGSGSDSTAERIASPSSPDVLSAASPGSSAVPGTSSPSGPTMVRAANPGNTALDATEHAASASSPAVLRASSSSGPVSAATELVAGPSSPTASQASNSSAPAPTAAEPALARSNTTPAAAEPASVGGTAASTATGLASASGGAASTAAEPALALGTAALIAAEPTPVPSSPILTAAQQVASSTGTEQASAAPASLSPTIASGDSAPKPVDPPIVVRTVETPALRRSTTFGLRWGREKSASQPAAAPASAQPAVPFTVAASTAVRAEEADGMTPWRAVAVRAAQQKQQQVSVAEAAPAEQETSA